MGKFGMRDFICPGTRVGPTEDPEVHFNLLVDTFCFTVRLGVVGSGEGEIIVEELSYPQNHVKFNSGSPFSCPPTPEHFRPASS